MCIRMKRIIAGAMVAVCSTCFSQTHTKAAASNDSDLQDHLRAAQSFQRSNKTDQAAEQYRAFLVEAMDKLAIAHAHNGDYPKAASLFDEALAIEPNSPEVRLEYARAQLQQGDLLKAQTLAKSLLNDYPHDSQGLAQAHQILGRALLKMNQDQDARKELEAAVALDPSFENGYDLAVVCLDLDDEKCASQIFGEMETSFGDTPEIHMRFGRAYGNSDFTPKAVFEFKKVIEENPRFPGAHYSLAAALLSTREDSAATLAAEKELKEELAVSPDDFLTYAALGKIASAQQKYADAETYLKRATSLNPNHPDAFLYLGQMYFDSHRTDEAKNALQRAIELTADESRNHFQVQKAHFLLGRILMQEHREDDAHAEMQKAREIANKGLSQDKRKLDGSLSNGAGSIAPAEVSMDSTPMLKTLALNPDHGAIRSLNELEKQLKPAIADSYNNLGVIAATANHYLQALDYFERAGEWNPSLDGLDLNKGRAAFMASRFSDAILPLTRYLRAHPEDSGIRGALAMSKFMNGDYAGCIEALGKAKDQMTSIPQMRFIYAESLVKTGQISLGIDNLQSLETSHPEIADVHKSLGEAHELQGERQEAVKELQTAVQLNANDFEIRYDLGKVELENGDAMAAIEDLESAIRLQPSDPKPHRELMLAYKAALRPADAEKELQIYNSLGTASAQPVPAKDASRLQDVNAP